MVIAVRDFEALCGFRALAEFAEDFATAPELRSLCGSTTAPADEAQLRSAFDHLLRRPSADVAVALEALCQRVAQGAGSSGDILAARLARDFPGDVGCFVAYFLNHLHLSPGESLFLGPNEPHAYLAGDCLECMAASDNTVRAGLTPKFKDVDTLIAMLTYRCGAPHRVEPRRVDEHVLAYAPPVEDFAVWRVDIPQRCSISLPSRGRAALLLVLRGKGRAAGHEFARGSSFFLPASLASLSFEAVDDPLELYIASTNIL